VHSAESDNSYHFLFLSYDLARSPPASRGSSAGKLLEDRMENIFTQSRGQFKKKFIHRLIKIE
jgi:hypothetical protein